MSIAQKQTREVLDEDLNINKQVMQRQIKQVTLSPEGYTSKRPIEGRIKYNVQRLINLFRLALEARIDVYNEGREVGDFSQVVETYNNLVNYANFFIKEENPSQNELSKLNDDLGKLNPLVDAVTQIADIGTSVDRNDMTELRNQWYADKKPIGLTEKGLKARLERTKKRTGIEEGVPEEGVSGAIEIEFQLQKLERYVQDKIKSPATRNRVLEEIRKSNNDFKKAQREYYTALNSEDPIKVNEKKAVYDSMIEDIIDMLQTFEERHPNFKTFEEPPSDTVKISEEEMPAYARKYYDLLDELNGMPETRYQDIKRLQEKINTLLKKHPQLRGIKRPELGQYDIYEVNPVTGKLRIDEAYDAENKAEDFGFYTGRGRRRMRGGAVEIPQRLNRERGLPTAYRQELAQASLLNKGASVRNEEKRQLRKMEIEKGENHGSKSIDNQIDEAQKKTIQGMGKRKQLNYREEKNEMYY